jgi:hypothetical protein
VEGCYTQGYMNLDTFLSQYTSPSHHKGMGNLHLLVQAGDVKAARDLIGCEREASKAQRVRDCSVNSECKGCCSTCPQRGYAPLHFAVISDSQEMASMLLEEGADINLSDYAGLSPLHVALYEVQYL